MTITNDDVTRLARAVLTTRDSSYIEDAGTAAAGIALARAVIARDAQAAAAALTHHEHMADIHRRAIDRLGLAPTETGSHRA